MLEKYAMYRIEKDGFRFRVGTEYYNKDYIYIVKEGFTYGVGTIGCKIGITVLIDLYLAYYRWNKKEVRKQKQKDLML